MQEKSSPLEILTGLLVLVAVGAQTWVIVQDSTQGDAGRWVVRFWQARLRPQIVRVAMWLDAKALTDRMVIDEITPLLKGDQ